MTARAPLVAAGTTLALLLLPPPGGLASALAQEATPPGYPDAPSSGEARLELALYMDFEGWGTRASRRTAARWCTAASGSTR